MPEHIIPGPAQEAGCCRESTCIHTRKIYDSCQSRDCAEDLRLYLTEESQTVADRAQSLRNGTAELLYVSIDVAPISFNRGFYTIDLRYFCRVTADACVGTVRPTEITGLAVFDKRAILFGSEGSARIFSSQTSVCGAEAQDPAYTNLPIAVVEAVDPMVLTMRLTDACPGSESEISDIPASVLSAFDGTLVFDAQGGKQVCLTLGQFTLLRLERDTQLLIPFYDYCMPERECDCSEGGSCEQDPCELFQQVQFPVGEFFPPATVATDPMQSLKQNCCNR